MLDGRNANICLNIRGKLKIKELGEVVKLRSMEFLNCAVKLRVVLEQKLAVNY